MNNKAAITKCHSPTAAGTALYPLLPPAEAYFQEKIYLKAKFSSWKNVTSAWPEPATRWRQPRTARAGAQRPAVPTPLLHAPCALRVTSPGLTSTKKPRPILWAEGEVFPEGGSERSPVRSAVIFANRLMEQDSLGTLCPTTDPQLPVILGCLIQSEFVVFLQLT